MKLQPIARLTAIAFATMFIAACAATPHAALTIPDTPDGTVRAVAEALADDTPSVLWETLPPSYREDINDLTATFVETTDPELYNKAISVVRQAVTVLRAKREIILGSSFLTSTDIDEQRFQEGWDGGLKLLDTLLSSEISSLESLATIDYATFLDSTGRELMAQADALARLAPDAETAGDLDTRLTDFEVDVIESAADTATLRITPRDGDPETVQLVRVEGRWVPQDLADGWKDKVAEAKKTLLEAADEDRAQMKMQAMLGLAMVESFVDQLAAVETSEDFDTLLQGLLGGMLGGLGAPSGG